MVDVFLPVELLAPYSMVLYRYMVYMGPSSFLAKIAIIHPHDNHPGISTFLFSFSEEELMPD